MPPKQRPRKAANDAKLNEYERKIRRAAEECTYAQHIAGCKYPPGTFGALLYNVEDHIEHLDWKALELPPPEERLLSPDQRRMYTHACNGFSIACHFVSEIVWGETVPSVGKFLWYSLYVRRCIDYARQAQAKAGALLQYWPKETGIDFRGVTGDSAWEVALQFADVILDASAVRIYHHPVEGIAIKFADESSFRLDFHPVYRFVTSAARQIADMPSYHLLYDDRAYATHDPGPLQEEFNYLEVEPSATAVFTSWRDAVLTRLKTGAPLVFTDRAGGKPLRLADWPKQEIERDSQVLLSKMEDEYKRALSAMKEAEDDNKALRKQEAAAPSRLAPERALPRYSSAAPKLRMFGGLTAAEYTKHCDEVRMAEIAEKQTAALLALAKAAAVPATPGGPGAAHAAAEDAPVEPPKQIETPPLEPPAVQPVTIYERIKAAPDRIVSYRELAKAVDKGARIIQDWRESPRVLKAYPALGKVSAQVACRGAGVSLHKAADAFHKAGFLK